MVDGTPAAPPAGETPPAPPAGEAPAAPPADWTTGLNDEHKTFVTNKGFKDASSVVDSYVNLEKLLGAPREKLVTLPDSDDAEGLGKLYDKLGRPADKKDYKIELPEGAQSEDFVTWAKDTFHEHGLSGDQVENVMKKYGEFYTNQVDAMEETLKAEVANQDKSLRREWGAAHDQNIQAAKAAVKAFGIKEEQIDVMQKAMGYDGVMKFLHEVGTKIGEHKFVSGDGAPTGGAMIPTQAQAKIKELTFDKNFQQKMGQRDAAAIRQWDQLHEWAFPPSVDAK